MTKAKRPTFRVIKDRSVPGTTHVLVNSRNQVVAHLYAEGSPAWRTDTEPDKLENARKQGQAQFDSIKEMVAALEAADSDDFARTREDAERSIHEDALSVSIRSGWYGLGDPGADTKPAEYEILLCIGGPACRIIGQLSAHGEPETAVLEVQDWFTPWTSMRPLVAPDDYNSEPILLAYARCFYFGED